MMKMMTREEMMAMSKEELVEMCMNMMKDGAKCEGKSECKGDGMKPASCKGAGM